MNFAQNYIYEHICRKILLICFYNCFLHCFRCIIVFNFQKYDKPKYVLCFTFSPDGDVLTGDSNGNILVWPRGMTLDVFML